MPLPNAYATTVFSDNFESGNLNEWVNYGGAGTPPTNTAIDSNIKYNGTYSLGAKYNNDFWNLNDFAYYDNEAFTFKLRLNSSTHLALFGVWLQNSDEFYENTIFLQASFDGNLTLGSDFGAMGPQTSYTNIPLTSMVNRWNDIRVEYHNRTYGVDTYLFVNNSLKAYLNYTASPSVQNMSKLEFISLDGNIDNILIYTISSNTTTVTTTTITNTYTSTTTNTLNTTISTTYTTTITTTVTTTTITGTSTITNTVTSTITQVK